MPNLSSAEFQRWAFPSADQAYFHARNKENAQFGLKYELWGEAPVQALGTISGREFHFLSRHSEWEFEVANEQGKLPSDVREPPVFHRRGKYKNSSYMPVEVAVALIEQ
jgi:hypothetical protein